MTAFEQSLLQLESL